MNSIFHRGFWVLRPREMSIDIHMSNKFFETKPVINKYVVGLSLRRKRFVDELLLPISLIDFHSRMLIKRCKDMIKFRQEAGGGGEGQGRFATSAVTFRHSTT